LEGYSPLLKFITAARYLNLAKRFQAAAWNRNQRLNYAELGQITALQTLSAEVKILVSFAYFQLPGISRQG